MKYSPSTQGFYNESIHLSIPNDAIDIPDDEYITLFENQGKGMEISHNESGYPINLPVRVQTQEQQRSMMKISSVDFQLNLLSANLLQTTLDIIATLTDLNPVKIKWKSAPTFFRLDPDLESFCLNELRLTDEGIDNLFIPIPPPTGK
jgi:hypothetical protein